MVSHSPGSSKPQGLETSEWPPRIAAAHDPLEDSQITTTFDGVCGTKSVETVRSKTGAKPVVREIGHVAEPMF